MTPPPVRFVLTLTPSQRMALLDIITAVMVPPLQMREYVDVVAGVTTTPGELFSLVMHAPTEPATEARGT